MSSARFVPGLELASALYDEAVAPLLAGVRHSAALIGTGSDVLGFDTARSTDHGWGPRLQVFVEPADVAAVAARIDAGLPDSLRGWPVRYGWEAVPVQHHVTVTTLPDWLLGHLGVDATRPLATADWLVTPQHLLLGVVAGAVFRDDTGALARVREGLAWYPEPVWRWLLGCQWRPPDLETREAALGMAYEALARRFNELGLIEPVDPELRQFHNRPARVLMAYRFADPCMASVTDPALRALPPIGAVDQVVDTSDALLHPEVFRRFREVWSHPAG